MTEIIHVEPNTKPDAIRRQLARLDSGQVAVVLPEGWVELDNFARLRLLQRQARLRDQHLALVTQDLSTRKTAQALGIPIFGNEAAILGRTWRMHPQLPDVDPHNPAQGLPDPPPWRNNGHNGRPEAVVVEPIARPHLYRSRQRRIEVEEKYRQPLPFWLRLAGYVLSGLFLAGLLGAFLFYVLPAATVTVVPGQRQIEATASLTADPAVEVADLEIGLIPARFIEIYVESTGTILTSGSEQAATQPARGAVVFTNQTNQAVRIPAGTTVSTSTGDRVDFRTLFEVEIPGPSGSRATVEVEATEPGTRGNVRANTIATVSGALGSRVRVTNPSATGGGQSDLVRVVTQTDRETLYDQVYAEIQDTAYDRLLTELREGEWVPRETVQTFVTDQIPSHFNGEPAQELSLTLRVLIRGTAIDQAIAQQATMQALENAVPERAKLVADSIQFYEAPDATVDNRQVRFGVIGRGNYVIPIDSRELRSVVAGLTQEEASALLQERWLLARPPEFYQDPDWLGTLPRIASRIQVRVEYAEAVSSGQ